MASGDTGTAWRSRVPFEITYSRAPAQSTSPMATPSSSLALAPLET